MLKISSFPADEQRLTSDSFVHPPVLIIGLGNPILGDDGVGWRVADCVRNLLNQSDDLLIGANHKADAPKVEIDCQALGGLALMERMVGYEKAILIDAIELPDLPTGSIKCFPLSDLPASTAERLASSHDTTLQTALQIGKEIDAKLPDKILVIGIKINTNLDFSENLSEPVLQSVSKAAKLVMELINDIS